MAEFSLEETEGITRSIITVRGQKVIQDSDLAALFEVETKRLNQQVKRNAERFGKKYSFQLTQDEFDALRSQSATSKPGRGGRRYPPRVFTEHGVVMAATVLNSEKAIEASKLIVDVFVEVKNRTASSNLPAEALLSLPDQGASPTADSPDIPLWESIRPRLQQALNQVLDTVIDQKKQSTIREEAEEIISESIDHLKERLKKARVENEEMAAHASKLLAEAEKEKSVAAKTRAEADELEFKTTVRKLRLLIEAHKAMSGDDIDGFVAVLKDLGDA